MYKNRIYRQIAADCTKAYWSSILFYALQLIVSQVAVAYSARMLGVFSAYILNNEIQKGLGCLWQILICVAISVTLPLACSTMGELLMFRASLNHERAVLNRYLNKTYAAAVGLRGSDAQFRLEEDQTQLGIYWNTTGMYLVSVPIVVIYLLWQMVPVMGWFTLFVEAVCCVPIMRCSGIVCSFHLLNSCEGIFPEKNRRIRQAGAGKSDKDAESRAGDAGKTGGTLPLWSAK